MPRATWSGSISFGLVNVPVRLFSAVQEQDVHFHQLQKKTGARVRYKKVSEKSGRELDADDIIRAYELPGGKYVPLTDEEIESVEPERSHTISLEDFVPWQDIDPMYFQSTYWVAPTDAKGAKKAYVLLMEAMQDAGRVGIGRYVMRTKEHLVTLRPTDQGAIALHGMSFPDEIVAAKAAEGLPVRAEADRREVRMARQLIESLAVDWDPKRYKDTHRKALLGMIERKAGGEDIVAAEPAAKPEKVTDLMAALEASLESAKGGKGRTGTRRTSRRAKPRKRSAA
jgi:DNA end-binding protein Ku